MKNLDFTIEVTKSSEPSMPTLPDLTEGLRLNDAITRWCDPTSVEELRQLFALGYAHRSIFFVDSYPTESDLRNLEALSLRESLEEELIAKLRMGQLFAVGYDSRAPLDAKPVRIPPDRWRELVPDFEESTAKAEDFSVTCILVFENIVGSRPRPDRTGGRIAQAKVRKWYGRWIEQNNEAGEIPSREDDWAAAKKALGNGVARDVMRELRREMAPESWRRGGRRKLAKQTGDD